MPRILASLEKKQAETTRRLEARIQEEKRQEEKDERQEEKEKQILVKKKKAKFKKSEMHLKLKKELKEFGKELDNPKGEIYVEDSHEITILEE